MFLRISPELFGNLLFPEAGQIAFSPVPAATVINVFPLFEFRRHRAIVMRTGEHSPKSNVVLSVFPFVMPVHTACTVSNNCAGINVS